MHTEIIIAKLTNRSIKPTAMRLLVAEKLFNLTYAVSLAELEELFEKADRVTLYRTLKTFEEHKLIHRVEDGMGTIKYAFCNDHCECTPNEKHLHFHCLKCKHTYCLDENIMPKINLPNKFCMQEINILIKGLCETCSCMR